MMHSRIAALSICLLLGGAAFAQEDQTNRDAVAQAQHDAKQDRKVNKAQAKADKKAEKAAKSDKVKKAAKAQDKPTPKQRSAQPISKTATGADVANHLFQRLHPTPEFLILLQLLY